ncbi:MAG: SdpI family protein [Limnohabitans sp.]|nr:SdpI family protein [Limnohabitans sp.]
MFLDYVYHLPIMIGNLYVITSLITIVFPPKKINSWHGYRTPASMKSEAKWNFTQKNSSYLMLKTGFILLLISSLKTIFGSNFEGLINFTILFVSVVIIFFKTEKAIKKNFSENVS